MTRTSHYAWMALGGVLGLLGVFVVSRARDGNKAMAQSEPPAVVSEKPAAPPRMLPPISTEPLPAATDPAPAPPAPPPAVTTQPQGVPLPPVDSRHLEKDEKKEKDPATRPEGIVIQAAANEPLPPPPAAPPAAGSDSRPIVIPASATGPAPPPPGAATPPPPSPSSPPPPTGNVTSPPPAEKADLPAPPSPAVASPPPAPPAPATEALSRTEPPKDHAPEPPLAPTPGPVVQFRVQSGGETFRSLARKMLGSSERWGDIHKLNPTLPPDSPISVGVVVRLPGDACVSDDHDSVRPLPPLRPRSAPKPKAAMPLTGTFPIALDDHKVMTLPRKILEQLGHCDTVLLSPGSDRCLWLTNQAHLDRLQAKLDRSPARESDVRGFKRLYYAQTVKAAVKDGKLAITDKLAAFAGLGAEVVLVGIDDHFEIWDAARWRKYTQAKKATTAED